MSAGTQKSAHLENEIADARSVRDLPRNDAREWQAQRLRLLWQRRRFFAQVALGSLFFFTLVAFLIPRQFTATTVLMPPDSQSASGLAMMAMAAKGAGGLGSMAGDLLGLKSSGALFIGVLRSQTSQNRMVEQFNLRKVYGKKLIADAREKLDQNTSISEDRKSGMLYINVTDHSAERSAALANAYVDGLNSLVAELSTSSARRERQFLDERLKVIKQDLDTASTELAQFSSRNNTLDIKDEGKAMLEAAANLSGQMIAATAGFAADLYRQQSESTFAKGPGDGVAAGTGKTWRRIFRWRGEARRAFGNHAGGSVLGGTARPACGGRRARRGTSPREHAVPYAEKFAAVGREVRGLLSPRKNSGNGLRVADRAGRACQGAGSQGNSQREGFGWRQSAREKIVSPAALDHFCGRRCGHGAGDFLGFGRGALAGSGPV